MSAGLCLGARFCNVNLVTRWAVDANKYAHESLKLNHPESQIRNEYADNFLILLKWKELCILFYLVEGDRSDILVNFFVTNDPSYEQEDDNQNTDNTEASDVMKLKNYLIYALGNQMRKIGGSTSRCTGKDMIQMLGGRYLIFETAATIPASYS